MKDASFTSWPAKYLWSNIEETQMIDLGYAQITVISQDKEIKQKSLHKLFLKDDGRGFEEDVNIYLNDKTDPPVAQKWEDDSQNNSTLWT